MSFHPKIIAVPQMPNLLNSIHLLYIALNIVSTQARGLAAISAAGLAAPESPSWGERPLQFYVRGGCDIDLVDYHDVI